MGLPRVLTEDGHEIEPRSVRQFVDDMYGLLRTLDRFSSEAPLYSEALEEWGKGRVAGYRLAADGIRSALEDAGFEVVESERGAA